MLHKQSEATMRRYNIEVELAALNWSDPETPLLGHCLVQAPSPEKARAIVASIEPYKGRPNRVVPPFGMPCRADLSVIDDGDDWLTPARPRGTILPNVVAALCLIVALIAIFGLVDRT